MATLYSNAVSSTGKPPQNTNASSFARARKRETWATYTGTPTTSDVLIIAIAHSGDRLKDIQFFTDGAGTNGALNIGLHRVDSANGALSITAIDADLFASAKATGTAILHGAAAATVFTEAGTLIDQDRGKALWQLAGTYTADPGQIWAITATPSTSEDASSKYCFQVDFVAGD